MSILAKLFDIIKRFFLVKERMEHEQPLPTIESPPEVIVPPVVEPEVVEDVEVPHVDTLLDAVKVEAIKEGVLTKDIIISSIISVEAGYVDHPDDRGGKTNMGITEAVAKENQKMLKDRFNWNGDMRTINYNMAYAIYEAKYWNKLQLDAVSKYSIYVADKMFDLGVNVGTARVGKWVQEFLNVSNRAQKDYADIGVDGGIGGGTMRAMDSLIAKRGKKDVMETLLLILISRQGTHYTELALKSESQESFYWGWVNNRLKHHLNIYMKALSK